MPTETTGRDKGRGFETLVLLRGSLPLMRCFARYATWAFMHELGWGGGVGHVAVLRLLCRYSLLHLAR